MNRVVCFVVVPVQAGLAVLLMVAGGFSGAVLRLLVMSCIFLGGGIVGDRGPELKLREVWSFIGNSAQPTGLRVGHAIANVSLVIFVGSIAVEIVT